MVTHQPLTYFTVAAGLPLHLHAVAAAGTVVVSRDIVGYCDLTIMVSHVVAYILNAQKTSHLSAQCWWRSHTALLDTNYSTMQRCNVLNPPTLRKQRTVNVIMTVSRFMMRFAHHSWCRYVHGSTSCSEDKFSLGHFIYSKHNMTFYSVLNFLYTSWNKLQSLWLCKPVSLLLAEVWTFIQTHIALHLDFGAL